MSGRFFKRHSKPSRANNCRPHHTFNPIPNCSNSIATRSFPTLERLAETVRNEGGSLASPNRNTTLVSTTNDFPGAFRQSRWWNFVDTLSRVHPSNPSDSSSPRSANRASTATVSSDSGTGAGSTSSSSPTAGVVVGTGVQMSPRSPVQRARRSRIARRRGPRSFPTQPRRRQHDALFGARGGGGHRRSADRRPHSRRGGGQLAHEAAGRFHTPRTGSTGLEGRVRGVDVVTLFLLAGRCGGEPSAVPPGRVGLPTLSVR